VLATALVSSTRQRPFPSRLRFGVVLATYACITPTVTRLRSRMGTWGNLAVLNDGAAFDQPPAAPPLRPRRTAIPAIRRCVSRRHRLILTAATFLTDGSLCSLPTRIASTPTATASGVMAEVSWHRSIALHGRDVLT
jgi:hypothetical protein